MQSIDDADAASARSARAALELLLADAPAIASILPARFLERAERFVAMLLRANRVHNLTRVTAPEEVARLHLLDALAALPIIDELAAESAIDLGSGGGLPGVPLALARPQLRWTLVDSVAKKAAVLRDLTDALGMPNVTVLAARAEQLGREPQHRERHTVATARALAALPTLVELALPLVEIGGALIAWKGALTEEADEVRRGRSAIEQLGGGQLAIRDTGLAALGGHRLIVVAKERPTQPRFPRRPGQAGRRPLA